MTEDSLRPLVRRLVLARLAALVATNASPPHDAGNLAQGWYAEEIYREDGTHYHGGERHRLVPAAAMQMAGNTLRVQLSFHIDTENTPE